MVRTQAMFATIGVYRQRQQMGALGQEHLRRLAPDSTGIRHYVENTLFEFSGVECGQNMQQSQRLGCAWGTDSEARRRLLEEIISRGNMMKAYNRVVSNKGAAGVDGMTTGRLKEYLQREWPPIKEELLNGTYEGSNQDGLSRSGNHSD